MSHRSLPTAHVNTLCSHTGPINCIAFSHLGGTYILTGSSDRSIHLSRTEPSRPPGPSSSSFSSSPAPASAVTAAPSISTTLASTSASPASTPTPAPARPSLPIQKYTSHGYAVLSLSVATDNTHFASTGGDRSIFYWDIQSPSTTVRRFGSNTNQAHTSRITCCSFAAKDDSLLVSGSDDRTVRLWDVKSRDARPLQIFDDAKDSISSIVVCHDSYEILAGSVDGRVRCYDVRMGTLTTDVQPGAVTSLDLSPDGKVLLVSCLDGKIRAMDRSNGAMLRSFPPVVASAPPSTVRRARSPPFSSANEELDVSNSDGYKNESLRLQSCFGANGSLILSGSESDGNVRAWDVLSGKLVGNVHVSEKKVVSVVKWRAGDAGGQNRGDVWAAGGVDGVVRIYARS